MATKLETLQREILGAAEAWLAIGGRIAIDPVNRGSTLRSAIDADAIFAANLSPDTMVERTAVSRLFHEAFSDNADVFRALVKERGVVDGDGFLVWQSHRPQWDDRLATYTRARQYSDGLPAGDPAEDMAVDAYCDAMDRLVAVPAPDLPALAMKIDFMLERECFARDWLEIFAADARRLHSEGR